MKVDGRCNCMFGLPPFDRIDNVRKGLTSSQKIFLFFTNSVNFLIWSGEGSKELQKLQLIQITGKGECCPVENYEVTTSITNVYHQTVYSYAEDKSIFYTETIDINQARRMTARVWQFFKQYIGHRKTDYRLLILDLTYTKEDLGETILGENAIIRINISRHFGYLHLLSTYVHELAHFLENRYCEDDHGNTFYCLGLTLLNMLQCSHVDLTEFGISQTDIEKLEISIM